jgi:hypothetical protein
MQLFQLLATLDPKLRPEDCKVHLAGWTGTSDPLEVYLAGRFEEWQTWQTRQNFERQSVVSLIAMKDPARWLFAGCYDSHGCKWNAKERAFRYSLTRRPQTDELDGRLVVSFRRPGRQSYLLGEKWSTDLRVTEIRPERMRVAEFPGYSWTRLSKQQLDIVVEQHIDSWAAALGSVSGIYLITDCATGKLYVGSAAAGEGIWSRWVHYSRTGHGGNRELKDLLRAKGAAYAGNFQFAVLEIADTHASKGDILERESFWKEVLRSREFGYNAN